MKEIVVVEREYETATDPCALHDAEAAVRWCLEQHQVVFLYAFLAEDRRHFACVYEAPDVEAMRTTQRVAGMRVTRAWRADVTGDAAGLATGRRVVVALHDEPTPAGAGAGPLLDLLARDGTRRLTAYDAPVDAVRAALPTAAVWTAEVKQAR